MSFDMDPSIEDKMEKKLALRLQGKSTRGLGEDETMNPVDKTQMLATNRTAIAAMQKSHYINMEWKLVSRKKVIGKPIVFVKRIIRKGARWYVKPPIMQQSEFNRNSLEVIKNLQTIVLQQQETIRHLQEEQTKYAQILQEQITLHSQTLAKLHRDMDTYQPYLDLLLEWKSKTDDLLNRCRTAIEADDDILATGDETNSKKQ